VGPTGEGVIPAGSAERLHEVGAWLKVNGEAIHGTTGSPFKKFDWGRCTKKSARGDTTLYLHVFNWPADGKLLVSGLRNAVVSASLLAGGKFVSASNGDEGVLLTLPATAPDSISSTIVLNVTGEVK